MSDRPDLFATDRGDLGEDDVVERFFARARDEVEELPGNDLHLQGILRSARGPRRTRRWLAVGAAAALVVGVATSTVLTRDDTVVDPAGPPSTVDVPDPSSPTPVPDAEPMDGHLLARSFSAADTRTRAVLGAARCDADLTCPVLLRTTDDGASWTNTAAMPDLTVAPPDGISTEPDQVGLLRWADASTGYVAGTVLRRTTDGGLTWADMPYPGGTIVAMEIAGDVVRLVSAGDCTVDGCTGPVKVYTAGTDEATAEVVALEADVEQVTDVQLVTRDSTAYLAVHTPDGSHAYRTGEQPATITPCEGEGAQTWFASPATGEGPLSALCVQTDGDATSVLVRSSTDEGATWTDTGAPTETSGAVTGFTSPSPGTFVTVMQGAGGPDEAAGKVLRSTDDGRTWAAATAEPARWTWVAAGGGDRVYGLAEDAEGVLVSEDGGASWSTQVLAP